MRRVHPDKEQRLWGSFSLPCVLHGTHSSPLFPALLPASAKISSALLFSPLTTIRRSQREPPCCSLVTLPAGPSPAKGALLPTVHCHWAQSSTDEVFSFTHSSIRLHPHCVNGCLSAQHRRPAAGQSSPPGSLACQSLSNGFERDIVHERPPVIQFIEALAF